jgi:hypothetical protein
MFRSTTLCCALLFWNYCNNKIHPSRERLVQKDLKQNFTSGKMTRPAHLNESEPERQKKKHHNKKTIGRTTTTNNMVGTNNDLGGDEDDHDDHHEDDNEALLDAFPLSLEELHRLQQAYDHDDHRSVMIIPNEPLLTKMLQQSAPVVFCCRNNDDPKYRWLETIVSVCGRRGDRFLLDMMGRFFIEHDDDDPVIESFVSLLLQECCYH